MPQNIFKIYDGRTSFWQWDVGQKLIVLDDSITEVHFSNRDMNHSISKHVYEKDGVRMCNIPDIILQLPRNLVVYACNNGATVKSVKFAVIKRPVPDGYVVEQNEEIEDRLTQIDIMLDNINENKADDIYYDQDGQYIQLTANGEPVGTRVELPNSESCGIDNCNIDENGHLIVTLVNGKVIDAGYVGTADGVIFTPHISEDKILTWTCNQDLPVPDPIDLNPFDEWSTIPEEGIDTEYEWEFL